MKYRVDMKLNGKITNWWHIHSMSVTPKTPAPEDARLLSQQQQGRRSQVGNPVDEEQCDPGEYVVLVKVFCQGEHLEIGEKGLHPHGAPIRFDEHPRGAGHSANADNRHQKINSFLAVWYLL